MDRPFVRGARWKWGVAALTASACLIVGGLSSGNAGSLGPLWVATVLAGTALASAGLMSLFVGWKGIHGTRHAVELAQELELTLNARADVDPFTGLYNRAALERFVDRSLGDGSPSGSGYALLIFDLDDFGELNLRYGRHIGDAILTETANRLRRCLRRSDFLARHGSDEFAVVLDDVSDPDQAFEAADRIVGIIEAQLSLGPIDLNLTTSTGVAISRECDDQSEKLFLAASLALSAAKADPGHRIKVCNDQLAAGSYERLDLMAELEQAMKQPDGLKLQFQPIVSLPTGEIVGMEALVRWEHPRLGLLLPEQFLNGAEMSGLSIRLGEVVIDKVISQLCEWDKSGITSPTTTVNVSGRQLRSGTVLSSIRSATQDRGLDPSRIRVELTDGFFARHGAEVARRIQELRSMGVNTAVDGLASASLPLGMLRELPIDRVKIDLAVGASYSKLADMADGTLSHPGRREADPPIPPVALPPPFDLVKAVIDVLGIPVAAKGVEDAEHLELARALGCDQAQGSYLGAPVPPDDAAALIRIGTTHFSP